MGSKTDKEAATLQGWAEVIRGMDAPMRPSLQAEILAEILAMVDAGKTSADIREHLKTLHWTRADEEFLFGAPK